MFGFQEMLFIAAIILAVIFIPKAVSRKSARRPVDHAVPLSGAMRIAIVVSVVYPALAAAYFEPWRKDPVLFLYIGVGPVVLTWLLFWATTGFRK